jgi:hypothetical protein
VNDSDVREPDGVEQAQQVEAGDAQVLDAEATAEILESRETDTRSAEELDERDEREAFGEDRLPMGPPLEDDEATRPHAEADEADDVDPTDPVEAETFDEHE